MIAPRFARKEAVANVTALVMGLMAAAVGSKNCWTLAEHAGHLTPTNCSICWHERSGMRP